jgi:hypothetical protein
LAAELRRFLKDEPILAKPAGRLEKRWRMSRRNPAMFGLMATVILLLGGFASITVWSLRSGRDTPPSSPKASNREPDTPTDDLLRVVAELDRTDRDWRLERIEAKRKVIPDDRNSAARVRMVRRLFDVQLPHGPNKGRYRDLVMRRGLLGKLDELYPELTAAEVEEFFQGRTEGSQSISSLDNSLKDLTPWTPLSPERAATVRMALENAGPALTKHAWSRISPRAVNRSPGRVACSAHCCLTTTTSGSHPNFWKGMPCSSRTTDGWGKR